MYECKNGHKSSRGGKCGTWMYSREIQVPANGLGIPCHPSNARCTTTRFVEITEDAFYTAIRGKEWWKIKVHKRQCGCPLIPIDDVSRFVTRLFGSPASS